MVLCPHGSGLHCRVAASSPSMHLMPIFFNAGDGFQGAEYPDWWGDGAARYAGQQQPGAWWPGGRSRSAPRPGRPPPRLAYSVQLEPQPVGGWGPGTSAGGVECVAAMARGCSECIGGQKD